jgi:hypothetical protein
MREEMTESDHCVCDYLTKLDITEKLGIIDSILCMSVSDENGYYRQHARVGVTDETGY